MRLSAKLRMPPGVWLGCLAGLGMDWVRGGRANGSGVCVGISGGAPNNCWGLWSACAWWAYVCACARVRGGLVACQVTATVTCS